MIDSITLRNFRSFGAEVTVPLSGITILVGPNNSGKSCFMSVGEFFALAWEAPDSAALLPGLVHAPVEGDGRISIGLKSEAETVHVTMLLADQTLTSMSEIWSDGTSQWKSEATSGRRILSPFRTAVQAGKIGGHAVQMLLGSSTVKLVVDSLRAEAQLTRQPSMAKDGTGIAAVINDWRNNDTVRARALEQFVTRCVPEIVEVMAPPSEKPGHCALRIRQTDGQAFDAPLISDGILYFIGLGVAVLKDATSPLVFIEEPENGIHPPAIHELVDLLRRIRRERDCQFVIATHSRTFIDQFRNEPDAILRFLRTPSGTRVDRVSDVPELMRALEDAPPGDLIEANFFNTFGL